MGKWFKSLFAAGNIFVGARNTKDLLLFIFPGASGAVMAWLATVQNWPWPEIFLGVMGAVACAVIILHGFSRWLLETSPNHKFRVESISWNIAIENGKPKNLAPVVVVRNLAKFPLSFVLDKVDWNFARQLPSNEKPPANSGAVMEPEGGAVHITTPADITHIDYTKPLEGEMKIEISYGRPGREKYKWQKSYMLTGDQIPLPNGQGFAINVRAFDQP